MKNRGIQVIICSQTEGHCGVFVKKIFFFLDSVHNSVMLGQKMEKKAVVRQAVVFLIYVFANVLISNMLHKVECVFQPDELSLWRGYSESRELRVRGNGRREGGVVGYLIWG